MIYGEFVVYVDSVGGFRICFIGRVGRIRLRFIVVIVIINILMVIRILDWSYE